MTFPAESEAGVSDLAHAGPSLINRYRKSFIAIILFAIYAAALFFHNLSVQQRLEQSLLDAASLELAKRAETISAYFSERHNTLANMAGSDALNNYFAGHDLGMSIEYGLGVHIQLVEDRFEQLIAREHIGGEHIYRRITLVDPLGQVIAESDAQPAQSHEDYFSLVPQLGDKPSVALLDMHKLLRFSQPVILKGGLRGHVIAYSPVAAIASRAFAANTLRPEAMVVAISGEAMSPGAPTIFSDIDVMRLLSALGFSGTQRTTSLPSSETGRPIAVIKQGIENSPLALATLITAEELSAYSIPSLFLVAVGAVPFIVLYIILLELHQRRRFETVLITARAEAERLAQLRSDFIANMGHEIRTPMNAVIGLTELTLETELTLHQRDCLSKAQKSAKALLRLLNNILDYSKIESGQMVIENIPFSLQRVITDIEDMFAFRFEEKGVSWRVFVAPEVPAALMGDPFRLGQVLVNLVGNAIKFTDQGEIALRVEVVSQSERNITLKIAVRDTGIGLHPDQFERVFSSFTQADNTVTRKYGGTGLGLSICRHLVEMMGGRIFLESQLGVGTTFLFTVCLMTDGDLQQVLEITRQPVELTRIQPSLDMANKEIDFRQLESLTAELDRMLTNKMLDARELGESIQELIAGTKLERDFVPVWQATQQLRFKDALLALPAFVLAQNKQC